ncbi:hypothetical protein ACC736_38380, partial [Rhizobium ruizarguesonis]
ISATCTDHFFDLQAYNAQIEEVKRLGGEPIAVDAGRNDGKLVSQLQTLIAQKPDAIGQNRDPGIAHLLQPGIDDAERSKDLNDRI